MNTVKTKTEVRSRQPYSLRKGAGHLHNATEPFFFAEEKTKRQMTRCAWINAQIPKVYLSPAPGRVGPAVVT